MKNTESFEAFRSSLLRCLSSLQFLEDFYDNFISSSEEVKNAFSNSDMERQKAMLHASLYQLMNFYEHEDEQAHRYIEELGAKHGAYGHRIPLHLYDLWLESLIKSVAAADPMFSPELESIWREVMTMGIEVMKASSHRYPKNSQEKSEEPASKVIRSSDVEALVTELRQFSKDAAHRSNVDKDMEVTAFQFGQYRAYLHACERLSDLLKHSIQV